MSNDGRDQYKMRRHHDMGGLPDGPVDTSAHEAELWEKRVDAMRNLLGHKKLYRVDEHRRHIEDLPPGDYDGMSYYERWILAISQHMIERGVFTSDELGRKMAEVEAREANDRERYK